MLTNALKMLGPLGNFSLFFVFPTRKKTSLRTVTFFILIPINPLYSLESFSFHQQYQLAVNNFYLEGYFGKHGGDVELLDS